MNKKFKEQTFEQGAAVLFISAVLVKLIGAFFKIPLSWDICLGDLGFGYFSYCYDIYIPIYTLASSGFPMAISRIVSEYLAKNDRMYAMSLLRVFKKIMFFCGIIGTVLLILISAPLTQQSDKSSQIFLSFLMLAPAVFLSFISAPYRGNFEGFQNMYPIAISNLIEAFAKVIIGFAAAYFTVKLTGNVGYGAVAAMLGISIGTLFSFIYLKLADLKQNKNKITENNFSSSDSNEFFKKLLVFSLPIVFSSLTVGIVAFIDAITVKWRLSDLINHNSEILFNNYKNISNTFADAENLTTILYGIKSKAHIIFNLIPVFTTSLGMSALPIITKNYVAKNADALKISVNSAIKLPSVITFPISFGLIFIGTPIISLLFGDASAKVGGQMMAIYGFAAIFAGIVMPLTSVLQSIGKQNVAFLNLLIGLILKLIFNIILISVPSLNIYGSIISTVICFAYIFISQFYFLFKELGYIPEVLKSILKPLISGLCCGITAFSVCTISNSKVVTIMAIFCACGVYFGLLYLFKTFSAQEIKRFFVK